MGPLSRRLWIRWGQILGILDPDPDDVHPKSLCERSRDATEALAVLVILVLPACCFILSLILGIVLAVIEGWTLRDSFFLIMTEMTTTDLTLTEDADVPDSTIGRLMAAVISLIALGLFGVLVGLLGGPVLDPLVELAALTVPGGEMRNPAFHSMVKLAILLLLEVPATALVLSAIFGGLLAIVEGWAFSDSFYAVLVELSATNIDLVDTDNMVPDRFIGKLAAAVISLWALVLFACVLGVAGGPLCLAALNVDADYKPSKREGGVKMALFTFVGLPLICASVAALFAGVLSAVEKWDFYAAWLLVVMNLTACSVQLTDENLVPESNLGKLVAAYTGMVGLAIFAACLVILGGVYMAPFHSPLVTLFGHSTQNKYRKAFKLLMIVILGIMPSLAILLSLLFGGPLAAIEEWSFSDGFYVMLTELSGTDMQLVNEGALNVDKTVGKLAGALLSLWGMAIFAGVIGFIGGEVVGSIMETEEQDEAGNATDPAEADTDQAESTVQVLGKPVMDDGEPHNKGATAQDADDPAGAEADTDAAERTMLDVETADKPLDLDTDVIVRPCVADSGAVARQHMHRMNSQLVVEDTVPSDAAVDVDTTTPAKFDVVDTAAAAPPQAPAPEPSVLGVSAAGTPATRGPAAEAPADATPAAGDNRAEAPAPAALAQGRDAAGPRDGQPFPGTARSAQGEGDSEISQPYTPIPGLDDSLVMMWYEMHHEANGLPSLESYGIDTAAYKAADTAAP